MPKLILLLQEHGLLLVFLAVLTEQIGLPVPAYPILIVAGALVVSGKFSWLACLVVAMLACLISDFIWYSAGRRYGKRVLALLCRISLSPDYCVTQTEDKFRRWGAKSLTVSKFIPGFNTIAAPVAGASGISRPQFLCFSIIGSALWAGTGIAIGAIFHRSIGAILDVLGVMGMAALGLVASLLALFILFKFIERQRFYRALRMKRISVAELLQLIDIGADPVLLDARSAFSQGMDAPIPGARMLCDNALLLVMGDVEKDRHIIVYCSCPNDASAAKMAKELIAGGFQKVRPLKGGLEAWNMEHGAGA
jgi:membrane protein DedA with SNARE-associated domain/rhodanese-related sulfurtransferase